jgi:vanillate O-demethylase ferredoxin subunit
MQDSFYFVSVAARGWETPDIITFDLISPACGELAAFTAGAHIDVEVAPGLVRQYSLLNDPAERHRYRIGILKDPVSRGGSVAAHAIQAGAQIRIAGPRNHFELADGPHETLLLAGGIGITPLLCMAQQLHRQGKPFAMHYCARTRAAAAFLPLLATAPFAENVHLHFDDEADEQRLDLKTLLPALAPDAHLYVCGPGGFMAWCIDAALGAGIDDARVHREYFKSDIAAEQPGDTSFEVQLASTGAVYTVGAHTTILNVLREHGVPMPASCETGVCGTCLTGVLSGTPLHRDLYLTNEEKAAGDVILPCCSRAASALLVLDI